MGDSLDQERPAKRIKLEPNASSSELHSVPTSCADMDVTSVVPLAEDWMPPAGGAPPPETNMTWTAAPQPPAPLRPASNDAHIAWAPFAPSPAVAVADALPIPVSVPAHVTSVEPASVPAAIAAAGPPIPMPTSSMLALTRPPFDAILPAAAATDVSLSSSISPVSLPADFDFVPTIQPHPVSPIQCLAPGSHSPRLLLGAAVNNPPSTSTSTSSPSSNSNSNSPSYRSDQRRRKSRSQSQFASPFKDCIDSFGKLTAPRFFRPSDGNVNGYIKFHWPERKPPGSRSLSISAIREYNDDGEEEPAPTPSSMATVPSTAMTLTQHPSPESAEVQIKWFNSPSEAGAEFFDTYTSPLNLSGTTIPIQYTGSKEVVRTSFSPTGSPRLVPPHFGMMAKMDQMDRRFWKFYINNWCPGRSVLGKTNLWLQDFAKMHDSTGVLAAMQSLAGIYIYDYQPIEAIRKRTNQRFSMAESRLSALLDDRANLNEDEASELITIASVLSMQDVVLTERRLKKPFSPRWLQGYRQSEHFLEITDKGSRFWKKTDVQLSSLRISQSIIVGRAVILAQPMMALPNPLTFDPEKEAARFGWLLYGTQQDMYEIHGGCGFSKKLLHVISQITYCAARLQQDRESPVVPLTAKFLLGELSDMRQWSSESRGWEKAKTEPQIVEWVRGVPEGYVIDTRMGMTDVTAEAWRIAAMLYLQCRALRLPRNHPEVIENLSDLAKCIRIMPTSGTHFTAQAPLFPVFLLGILATAPDHIDVSKQWFQSVICTPVRSSVPPLYDALRRIWTWIDADPNLTAPPGHKLQDDVGDRRPWWERLVLRVQEEEQEVLCLT